MGFELDQSPYLPMAQIRLAADDEVAYWTRELAVDELSLRLAIACVGREELRVRDFLPALFGRAPE